MKKIDFKNKIKFSKINKLKISKKWIAWLNDPKVRRYSTQKIKYNFSKQKIFLRNKLKDKSSIIFAVFVDSEHIGNLEITRINRFHKHCEIMYLIGEKKYWNQGLGTIIVEFGVNYARKNLKLKKIIAGTFSDNFSSIKVLKKNNFKIEGKISNFYLSQNKKKRIDKLIFGKILR